jgi:hypothetical protein
VRCSPTAQLCACSARVVDEPAACRST